MRAWRAGARHERRRPPGTAPGHPSAAPDRRSDLARPCAGEPFALDRVDLIAFVNGPYAGLDPDTHPDNYTLAEIASERFHSHVGTFRVGGIAAASLCAVLCVLRVADWVM